MRAAPHSGGRARGSDPTLLAGVSGRQAESDFHSDFHHASPAARPLPVWLPGLRGEWRGPAGVCCVLTRPFSGTSVQSAGFQCASAACASRWRLHGAALAAVAALRVELGELCLSVWPGTPPRRTCPHLSPPRGTRQEQALLFEPVAGTVFPATSPRVCPCVVCLRDRWTGFDTPEAFVTWFASQSLCFFPNRSYIFSSSKRQSGGFRGPHVQSRDGPDAGQV